MENQSGADEMRRCLACQEIEMSLESGLNVVLNQTSIDPTSVLSRIALIERDKLDEPIDSTKSSSMKFNPAFPTESRRDAFLGCSLALGLLINYGNLLQVVELLCSFPGAGATRVLEVVCLVVQVRNPAFV